jgi:hypothetical protein
VKLAAGQTKQVVDQINENNGGRTMVTMQQAYDLTGHVVQMPDLNGQMWFHGIARERIKDDVYRFEVIQLAGRLVEAEIIASFEELAAASVASVA